MNYLCQDTNGDDDMRGWKEMMEGLLWLIFPRSCAVCGESLAPGEELLCPRCVEEMPLTWFWSWKGNPAEMKMLHRGAVRRVYSLFFYRPDSDYRFPVIALKYRHNWRAGVILGRMLGQKMAVDEEAHTIDAIVPVPLHRRKLRKRGYNQAEMIARGISQALGVPVVTGCLVRTRHTTSQTRLDEQQRQLNVKGAFALRRPLPSGHILIVDDILTTGATLEAVLEAVYSQRDVTVSIATLGYAEN